MEKIFPTEFTILSAEQHFSRFNRTTHWIYFLVISLVITGFTLLFFIRTDITILSSGIIRSTSEAVPITVSVNAQIEKSIIRENVYVNKGDTLLWLKRKNIDTQILYKQSLINLNNDNLSDVQLLLLNEFEEIDLQTPLYKRDYAEFRQRLFEFDLNLSKLRNSYNRSEVLFENNVISSSMMEEVRFQLDKKEEEKKIFIKLSKNKWQSQAAELELKIYEYKNEIQALLKEIENRVITAPYSGYIINYNGVVDDSFVASGQTIAWISPTDSLITEHWISPKDIGYLKVKGPASFQIDAYDHHLWGLASGFITEISEEVYVVDNNPYYRVRCEINEKHLILKNGRKGELKKGLTLTARFIITRKTIAQLFFEKIDQLFNPYHQP